MTSHPDLAELAAKALAIAPEATVPPSEPQEAKAIALMAGAIRARREREHRLRWTVGSATAGLAAAAAVVLAVGLARRHGSEASALSQTIDSPKSPAVGSMLGVVDTVVGEAYVLHGGESRAAVQGGTVAPNDQIVAPRAAGVAFELPTGTRVAVEEGGDVTVVAQGATQIFRLVAGSVRADVKKLGKGERFIVRTPDAEIEVHGTSFRVANVLPDPSCGGGTTTRLTVFEGVVTVRSGTTETSVPAGQAWPQGCDGAPATLQAPAPSSPAIHRAPRVSAVSMPAPSPVTLTPSQLAEQNDLYARAVASREGGDSRAAIAAFEQLMVRFPSGPLAENAAAERMTLLETVDARLAARAARDYVARYPAGLARSEADAILRGEPSRR